LAAGQATAGRDFGNFRPTTPPPPNTPPTVQPDSAETAQDAPVDIDVLANDTDDSGLAPGTVAIGTQPSHGSVAVYPANGHVVYTPASGFAGTDGFAYTVKDDDGATSAP